MSKFLSGRQSNLKLGVVGYTEGKTVLDVTGRVGVGTTVAHHHSLNVLGSTNLDGQLNVTGVSTFDGNVDFNGNAVVAGNLTVNGTQTILNTTQLEVEDINQAVEKLNTHEVSITGTGKPRTGAHGKPVVFLHPKSCNGTSIELEEV